MPKSIVVGLVSWKFGAAEERTLIHGLRRAHGTAPSHIALINDLSERLTEFQCFCLIKSPTIHNMCTIQHTQGMLVDSQLFTIFFFLVFSLNFFTLRLRERGSWIGINYDRITPHKPTQGSLVHVEDPNWIIARLVPLHSPNRKNPP